MFGKNYVTALIERSAENPADRRRFVNSASAAALGVVRAGLPGSATAAVASAQDNAHAIPDGAILDFALTLKYLEAEFSFNAVHGHGLPDSVTRGKGWRGPVEGGRAVRFRSRNVRGFAKEIARDEHDHVRFLSGAVGSAAVARPAISIRQSFTAAATAAGLLMFGQAFHVYTSEDNFLRRLRGERRRRRLPGLKRADPRTAGLAAGASRAHRRPRPGPTTSPIHPHDHRRRWRGQGRRQPGQGGDTLRAVRFREFGGPEVLRC